MIRWGVAAVLMVVVGGLVVARHTLLVVRVVGRSMEPTLRHGQRVLVRRTHRLRRHDVITFRPPRPAAHGDPPLLIKRVVALPGDIAPATATSVGSHPVPPGSIAVLGDGAVSEDSRAWGPIPQTLVVGRVVRIL